MTPVHQSRLHRTLLPHRALLLHPGMLKLVLSRGGRDELRIALHCFKDQLVAATCR